MKRLAFCIAVLLIAALGAQGGTATYLVNVQTQDLELFSAPPGPFSLGFELTDGSGAADINSAVVLSNFQFGSCLFCFLFPGSSPGPSGSPLGFGNYAGDLSSSVTLVDSDASTSGFAYFLQAFTAGDSLTFQLQLTTTEPEAGNIPDGFSFFIQDGSGNPLPTSAPDGYSFVSATLDYNSYPPEVDTYAWSDDPNVNAEIVPEPAGLSVLGLGALLALRKRCTRAAR